MMVGPPKNLYPVVAISGSILVALLVAGIVAVARLLG